MAVDDFYNGLPICFDFLRTFIIISNTSHGKACRIGKKRLISDYIDINYSYLVARIESSFSTWLRVLLLVLLFIYVPGY